MLASQVASSCQRSIEAIEGQSDSCRAFNQCHVIEPLSRKAMEELIEFTVRVFTSEARERRGIQPSDIAEQQFV